MNKNAWLEIINILRASDLDRLADMLESLGEQYYSQSENERQDIAREIVQMCNIRALGDVSIEGISIQEWDKLLFLLSKSIKKY